MTTDSGLETLNMDDVDEPGDSVGNAITQMPDSFSFVPSEADFSKVSSQNVQMNATTIENRSDGKVSIAAKSLGLQTVTSEKIRKPFALESVVADTTPEVSKQATFVKSVVAEPEETAPPDLKARCDDCGRTATIRKWRWCQNCERVLCETCIVESHMNPDEKVIDYATAVRLSEEESRQTMAKMRTALEKMEQGSETVRQMEMRIVDRLEKFKSEVKMVADESNGALGKFQRQMESLETVGTQPISAKWSSRFQSVREESEQMKSEVKDRFKAHETRLFDLDRRGKKASNALDKALSG